MLDLNYPKSKDGLKQLYVNVSASINSKSLSINSKSCRTFNHINTIFFSFKSNILIQNTKIS